jgi:hypothetical protein
MRNERKGKRKEKVDKRAVINHIEHISLLSLADRLLIMV